MLTRIQLDFIVEHDGDSLLVIHALDFIEGGLKFKHDDDDREQPLVMSILPGTKLVTSKPSQAILKNREESVRGLKR